MASNITIKATNICGGGTHATIEVSGDTTLSFRTSLETLESIYGELTNEQIVAALIRIARLTRTVGQTKTALASVQGLGVTI